MQYTPADGAEDPLAEEEGAADCDQRGREERQADDARDKGGDPLQLLGDRLELGLEEISMRRDKPPRGRDDPADAGPEPGLPTGRGSRLG